MPRQTVEFSQNQQKGLVQHLFFGSEFSLSDDALVIAQIDPDLSVTSGLIAQRVETTGGRGCAPYYERLLNVRLVSITRDISKESDPVFPKKQTDQDLRALQQIDTILHTSLRVPFTDREQADINERALTMFGYIIAWQPDLTARPKFPWNTAVNLALNRPADPWFSKYDHRVNILTNAPVGLVQKAMGEYANDGKNILERLYDEKPLGTSGMPEESPKLWEVIRRAPDGNLPLAQSTLLWALRVQSCAMYRAREQHAELITPDVLSRTWLLAQKKWNALSAGDKGKFLHMDILWLSKGMYQDLREHGQTPPPQMDQMLQTMIQTASDAWKEEFKQSLIAYIQVYPKAELGVIAEWFPIIAGIAEAHRPKSFFQKAAILFRRS